VASHVLSSDLFGLTGGGHVFLHPMYLLSGLIWRAGVGIQLAYLLWAPVAVFVLWWGFVAFARRVAPEHPGRRVAIVVLALGFASPIGWLSLPETHWVAEMQLAMSDTTAAIQPWFAFHTAIAVGVMALVLLGCAQLLDGDPRLDRFDPARRSPRRAAPRSSAGCIPGRARRSR
jgi:hypothetical protein